MEKYAIVSYHSSVHGSYKALIRTIFISDETTSIIETKNSSGFYCSNPYKKVYFDKILKELHNDSDYIRIIQERNPYSPSEPNLKVFIKKNIPTQFSPAWVTSYYFLVREEYIQEFDSEEDALLWFEIVKDGMEEALM